MNIRGAVAVLFGGAKKRQTALWQEINSFNSIFSPFTRDLYANDISRACIRTLAEHTAKANPIVLPKNILMERMMRYRPNLYMSGKDFLYKVRTLYEIHNTAYIFIKRDGAGNCIGLYPMPPCPAEAVESDSELYIKFYLANGEVLVLPWADLGVLRKDYNSSDVKGDDNTAILTSLELLKTTSEGMGNAIKSTANLRGILKSTKAMLSDDDVKKQKERFVTDYLSLENSSGIAMTDSTLTFTPLNIQPQIANYKNVEELRNNVYRYFGLNEDAVTGKLHGDTWEAFYENSIEPFLIALGLELTYKCFTDRQRGYGNEIIFESSRMQHMSMTSKLALVAMVDRGALTPNEWRSVMNLTPIDGGDAPLRRLDTATVDEGNAVQKEDEPEEEQT